MASSVADFYDGLAEDYHLVYGDRWDAAIDRQGASLTRVIKTLHPSAESVLDCSCGIGTQAIGLAQRGFRVHGTDLSQRSIARAGIEAKRRGAEVSFGVADFRDLSGVPGQFDVVLSCDNAIPHLLDDQSVASALAAMSSKLSATGLLLVSTRDFDKALIERPAVSSPQLIAGPTRHIVLRLHDWDAPESPLYTIKILVLRESDSGWTVVEHAARYRAIPSVRLLELATEVGLDDAKWRPETSTGFHQPMMTARNG